MASAKKVRYSHQPGRSEAVRKGPEDWERSTRIATEAVEGVQTDTSCPYCRQNWRLRHRHLYFQVVEGEVHHSGTWQLPVPPQRLWQHP